MFQTTVVIKVKTHFSENPAVYEIMWKIMVEPERPEITISYSTCALHVV
jgi:hypothetical protein